VPINSILGAIHPNEDGTYTLDFSDAADPEMPPCLHTISVENLSSLKHWLNVNLPVNPEGD